MLSKEQPWSSFCLWLWSLPHLWLLMFALPGKVAFLWSSLWLRRKWRNMSLESTQFLFSLSFFIIFLFFACLFISLFLLLWFLSFAYLKGEGIPSEAPGWKASKRLEGLHPNHWGKTFRRVLHLSFLLCKRYSFWFLFNDCRDTKDWQTSKDDMHHLYHTSLYFLSIVHYFSFQIHNQSLLNKYINQGTLLAPFSLPPFPLVYILHQPTPISAPISPGDFCSSTNWWL